MLIQNNNCITLFLFQEESDEAAKLKAQRVAEYAARKSKSK